MAKQKGAPGIPVPPAVPQIYDATLGPNGAVVKGALITQAQAEAFRQAGDEVVVCGPHLAANRALAQVIENNANGQYKRCPPHRNAGVHALPHYQPDPRGQKTGHTFYETPSRTAF